MKHFPKQKRLRLIALRKSLGFTQHTLSKASKVTIQTIFNTENGYHDPKHNTMRLLCKALDIPFDERGPYFDLDRSND